MATHPDRNPITKAAIIANRTMAAVTVRGIIGTMTDCLNFRVGENASQTDKPERIARSLNLARPIGLPLALNDAPRTMQMARTIVTANCYS